jgi:hypothetical protein
MKNPLGVLGDIFGDAHQGIGGIGGDYQWEKWSEGDPQWAARQRGMMNQQRSAMQQQLAAQQQQNYYQQKQYIAEPPSLDPELQMTQALVLLFGEHWELINEQLKKLAADEPDPSSIEAQQRSMIAGQKMW